jgi:nucleoside-diphosphate-sugar epimerase
MHIAVTGGSGRIGRAVAALALSQGHTVVSIDRVLPARDMPQSGLRLAQADMTDYAQLEQAMQGCDALVHLAAYPGPRGHADYDVHNNNVVGSYNALSAAARLGINRVCQASSINAIGGVFSRWPHYDYFPLDEKHRTYAEDPYSLSKWICEQQGDAFARRYETMTIASLRFHGVTPERPTAAQRQPGRDTNWAAKHLWGYTRLDATARACLMALSLGFTGHEAFYIVAPDTVMDTPSLELAQEFFPDVPVQGDLSSNRSFFNCEKAERLLGWKHNGA